MVEAAPTFSIIPIVTPLPIGTVFSILSFDVTVSASNQGQISSGGHITPGVTNAGDTEANEGLQAFLTYDLSGIAAGFTVDKVEIVYPSYDTLGTPFTDLGCMRAYIDNYGNLDAGDYHSGGASGAIARWCSEAQVSQTQELDPAILGYIQDHLGGQIQLRVQFNEVETNNDNEADVLRGTPQIIVYYH